MAGAASVVYLYIYTTQHNYQNPKTMSKNNELLNLEKTLSKTNYTELKKSVKKLTDNQYCNMVINNPMALKLDKTDLIPTCVLNYLHEMHDQKIKNMHKKYGIKIGIEPYIDYFDQDVAEVIIRVSDNFVDQIDSDDFTDHVLKNRLN